MKIEWILCPFCGSKTRLKIRNDTILDNFPLYCPKCKHESNGVQGATSGIKKQVV